MITKILAIAGNTFLETIRQPIYGIMLILTTIMMILNVSLAAYTLENDDLFLRDLGLSTLLVSSLFLAAFSAAGVLNREIENKTVMTVISKPVNRTTLILGKFVGLVTALAVAFYIFTIVLLMVMRHEVLQNTTDPWDFPVIIFGFGAVFLTFLIGGYCNFMYGWQFSSTAVSLITPLLSFAYFLVMIIDKEWSFQFPLLGSFQLLAAIFLVMLVVCIFAAIALAASCRLGQVATLTVCMVILMIGLSSDYFLGRHPVEGMGFFGQPSMATKFCWVAYRVVPNFSIFWISDALTSGKLVNFSYLAYALGYAVLYVIAFLMTGIAIFQKREVG